MAAGGPSPCVSGAEGRAEALWWAHGSDGVVPVLQDAVLLSMLAGPEDVVRMGGMLCCISDVPGCAVAPLAPISTVVGTGNMPVEDEMNGCSFPGVIVRSDLVALLRFCTCSSVHGSGWRVAYSSVGGLHTGTPPWPYTWDPTVPYAANLQCLQCVHDATTNVYGMWRYSTYCHELHYEQDAYQGSSPAAYQTLLCS